MLTNSGVPRAPVPFVSGTLALDRCPRCGIAKPLLNVLWMGDTTIGHWRTYVCTACDGVVLAMARRTNGEMLECLPSTKTVSQHVPERARQFLRQAQESLGQPDGALMLCASGLDAMLKQKGLKDGSLYKRIDEAAKTHLITDMAKWAHQVRLDANEPRHADEEAALPTQEDAQRCLTFALALAEVLFVLPARVTRGIEETKDKAT
jgi:Domain of unknown function (DUF4145)